VRRRKDRGQTETPIRRFSWSALNDSRRATGIPTVVTEELARNPDSFGGLNNHLVPTTSRGEKVDLCAPVSDTFTCDVAIFRLLTDNDFGRYRVDSRPLETFYNSAGSSRPYSLETFLGFYPTPEFSMEPAYTHFRFHYDHALHNSVMCCNTWPPGSLEHQPTLDVEYRITPNLMAGMNAETRTRQYVAQTNTVSVGGYSIVGAQFGYKIRNAGVATDFLLSGRDLGNKPCVAFTEPDPDGNSYHPAPHREMFGGVQVRF